MAIYLETKNKSLLDLIATMPEVSSEEADLLYKINTIFRQINAKDITNFTQNLRTII